MNAEQSLVFLAAIAYALFVVLEREHRHAQEQTAAMVDERSREAVR